MGKPKKPFFFSVLFKLLRDALTELLKNDPLRLAGATAFFTTFALPPILVILIQTLGIFFSTGEARQQLLTRLSAIVGKETVTQIIDTLSAFRKLAQNNYILVFGFLFLLFVATTLFRVIKSSLNQLWKIKSVHRSKIGGTLADRLKAVLVILVAGLLFAFGLFTEGLQVVLGKYIFEYSPLLSFYFNTVINYVLSVFMVSAWFGIVFRYLPDARPSWGVVWRGALLTGVLFTFGKVVLRWLLSYSNINTLYGTSASIVLLMLFVFYSSLILYYGAAFTKMWSLHVNQPIVPLHYASHYQLITDEEDDSGNET
jgi:membrane protein